VRLLGAGRASEILVRAALVEAANLRIVDPNVTDGEREAVRRLVERAA
jgi:hypothetical protein